MIRIFVAVSLAVSLAACATDDDTTPHHCSSAEGPIDEVRTFDMFNPPSLTCTEHRTRFFCTGECCIPQTTELPPTVIDCAGPCIGLDEATCIASTTCYVTRDRDAFDAGAPSFRACYPLENPTPDTKACATRDAYQCAEDGMCAGIYAQNATGPVFVKCADETATMP